MSENKEKEAKLKALQLAMDKLDKTYGKGSVMKLGDRPKENVQVIPSGSVGLDLALGVGGYPKGRIVEIYGPESSGKTTLAIHAIAEVQKQGGIAAFIDAGDAFNEWNDIDLEIGVGFGGRYRSPIGPVRVDVGFPEGRVGDATFHLSVGPDL